MVAQGEGVAGNSTAARYHFQQAAEAGFAAGLLNMAMLELYGWDGTANCTAALKYMRVRDARSMRAAPSLGYPHTPSRVLPQPAASRSLFLRVAAFNGDGAFDHYRQGRFEHAARVYAVLAQLGGEGAQVHCGSSGWV